MNEYLVPICDVEESEIYIETIHGTSFDEAENKLMYRLLDRYNFLSEADSYGEFMNICFNNNLLVGEIKELDELC